MGGKKVQRGDEGKVIHQSSSNSPNLYHSRYNCSASAPSLNVKRYLALPLLYFKSSREQLPILPLWGETSFFDISSSLTISRADEID